MKKKKKKNGRLLFMSCAIGKILMRNLEWSMQCVIMHIDECMLACTVVEIDFGAEVV